MQRLFSEHTVRRVESLDGIWRFIPGAGERPPDDWERAGQPIVVPSCWEMLPGYESWRGQAWIVRAVVTRGDGWQRVVFEGVAHTCAVYWNGECVGRHEDAFTPFEVFLPPGPGGVLALSVDNTFGDHSGLHLPNDYYSYGGIHRPVVIECVPETFLSRLRATPVRAEGGWRLRVRVRLDSPSGGQPATARCRLWLGGCLLGEAVTEASGGDWEFEAGDVEPWSPESPVLHELRAELLDASGGIMDDLIDRIGFREVRVAGDRIQLNGRGIQLRGFNRHEDHSLFGSALPLQAMAHDLATLRALGANFVRTSHYPNDRRFLDLCDEAGLLVWEESHARQISFDHPRALEQSITSTREMLDWHHNHPSIILWGCLNECDTKSEEGIAFHARILSEIKETDPSRPATYAGHFHENDRAMGLADVVSHNMYPGWYSGGLDSIGPHLEKFLDYVDSTASGGAGKPVLISEFGGGAIEGFRAPPMVRMTEDYQAALLAEGARVFLNHPRLSGLCIWQFADCRVCEEGSWWLQRPRCINDKGIVTRERHHKLAFDAVKRAFGVRG